MSDLPQGWIDSCIDDIAEVNPGRFGDIAVDAQISFVPMLAVSDIYGEIVNPTIRSYGEVSKGYTQFREGDVIFAKITPCMENGKIAVARALEGGMACGSTEFHVVRPCGAISSDFLLRYLRQKSFRRDAEASMTGAVGQRRVPASFLKEHSVALPPLPEQQRIVAKIDSLTGKSRRARDHLNHVPRLVQKYKQAILAAAFRGDWPSIEVGRIIRGVVAGKNLRCEERPPLDQERGVVKVSAVSWGAFDAKASKTLPASFTPPDSTQIKGGDLLISRANTQELVGAVVIVAETPSNLFLSDKVLRLDVVDEDKPWLMWFLRSPDGRAAIEAGATGNQLSMRNLSQSALKGIEMPWPTAEQRQEIVRRIESAFAWIDRLASDATSARKLIDHLDQAVLSKAFKGELVPQDSADEPASALLERIRSERAAAPKAKRGHKKAV